MRKLLIACAAVAAIVPSSASAAPLADGLHRSDMVRVTVNAKIIHTFDGDHVVVLPVRQWKTIWIHRGQGGHRHRHGSPRFHGTCSHSTYWWIHSGWYHRYIGYRLNPYPHTHVYNVTSFPGGLYYVYTSGPC